MKKALLFPILITINIFFSNAQEVNYHAVGYKLDMYGKSIDGYFSTDYEGYTDLKIVKNTYGEYVRAIYYDNENNRKSGLIDYNLMQKDFRFKKTPNDKSDKIKVEECKSFIISQDSFIVAKNLVLKTKLGPVLKKGKRFLQFLDQYYGMEFYKYYTSGINKINTHYFIKPKKMASYDAFPQSKNDFIEFCETHFSEFPALVEKIQNKEYDDNDLPTIIKLYKYKLAHINNERIFFDELWREIDNKKNSKFYAIIDSVAGTTFHLSYYTSNDIKLYSGKYKSVYPHIKEGVFTWYFPNGTQRKKIKYVDNNPHTFFTYYPNGTPYEKYKYDYNELRVFIEVNDSTGHNQLDEDGTGSITFYDPITERTIHNRYDRKYLMESFYKDDSGRKVYFLSPKDIKFKRSNAFKRKLEKDFIYPEESFLDGNYGIILVKIIVEPNGKASEIEVLKGIDSHIDAAVVDYLSYFKKYNHWRPGKVNGKKIASEHVIPIEFEFNSSNPYHNWNMFWMNQMMFQQHMMMQQSFSPPAPLSIPSNF